MQRNRPNHPVDKKIRQIQRSVLTTLEGFAKTLEAKDQYTSGHSARVVLYTSMILDGLAIHGDAREIVLQGAAMHDIGKLFLDLSVLNSPFPLTSEQIALFRSHPTRGREILEPIMFLRDLIPMVYCHHENFDGSGYPAQIKGEAIPFGARVVAVADSYDAMTSARAYRRSMKHSAAMRELSGCAGTQFDPKIVRIFQKEIAHHLKESGISKLLNHLAT